jgi:hypothetical protein
MLDVRQPQMFHICSMLGGTLQTPTIPKAKNKKTSGTAQITRPTEQGTERKLRNMHDSPTRFYQTTTAAS